ncbi:MAG: RNA-directed DNA polymerase [Turicibacter sp.]|nr:RNA-directed DNA polymerase [Turicibacter sp.]
MKRIGNLFEKIIDTENLKTAMEKAARGKAHRPAVKKVLENQEEIAETLKAALSAGVYEPKPMRELRIKDGNSKKERIIHQPKFYPDQIIHWAVMMQSHPLLVKRMHFHCIGSVPGKGIAHGKKYIEKWLRGDPRNTKYCLKMDVTKFYPSVCTRTLKAKFRTRVKYQKTLELLDDIIGEGRGLPIGTYTSQWFANFYLEDLDHAISRMDGVAYYVRYIDDMVIFGPNKRKLHRARRLIGKELQRLSLDLKPNWQVFRPTDRGVDFLGYRFFPDRTILRKRNALRMKRRFKKIQGKASLTKKDALAIISYWGWLKSSDSRHFCRTHCKTDIKLARKVVSQCAKNMEKSKTGS